MKSIVWLLFASLFLCVAAFATEGPEQSPAQKQAAPVNIVAMSLRDVLETALANNPEIRASIGRAALSAARVPAAGALDDPMVMYRNWGTPLSKPWDLNQAQNMFMVQQALPGFGKRAARSAIASQEADLAKYDAESLRRDVAVRVRKLFLDLLRNADDRRLHETQAALTREALSSAQVKYTVGKAPQQDVLKAQIALTRLAEHLIGLDEEAAATRAELNSLMGRSPDAPLEVTGRYTTETPTLGLLDLERLALDSRPELLALRKQSELADNTTRLAQLGYKPDFTLAAGYMVMPAGSEFRNNYMAEVTMSLPWLNRRKHNAEIAEAKAAAEVTRAEIEGQRRAVFLEIQRALIKVQAAQRRLKLYRDILRPQSEATFKSAAAAYQHDRTDFLNLIDSQNMLLDVQTSYYKAAADLDSRLAELERAVGASLPHDRRAGDEEEK